MNAITKLELSDSTTTDTTIAAVAATTRTKLGAAVAVL